MCGCIGSAEQLNNCVWLWEVVAFIITRRCPPPSCLISCFRSPLWSYMCQVCVVWRNSILNNYVLQFSIFRLSRGNVWKVLYITCNLYVSFDQAIIFIWHSMFPSYHCPWWWSNNLFTCCEYMFELTEGRHPLSHVKIYIYIFIFFFLFLPAPTQLLGRCDRHISSSQLCHWLHLLVS